MNARTYLTKGSIIVLTICTLAGCTSTPLEDAYWTTKRMDKATVQVGYQFEGKEWVLAQSPTTHRFRVLSPSEFERYHIPKEAISAFVERQDKYNYRVFFLKREKHGYGLYEFTFGKFDIDWPPEQLYQIGTSNDLKKK